MLFQEDTDYPYRVDVVEADAAAGTGDSKAPVPGTEETSAARVKLYPLVEKAEGIDNVVEVSPQPPSAEATNSSRSEDGSLRLVAVWRRRNCSHSLRRTALLRILLSKIQHPRVSQQSRGMLLTRT